MFITESFDDFYTDGTIEPGMTDIEGGREFEYVKPCSSIVDLDDRWQVWEIAYIDNDYQYEDDYDKAYVIVDIDSGFIDWLCDGYEEAEEFLNGKETDYYDDNYDTDDDYYYSDVDLDPDEEIDPDEYRW